MTGAWGDLPISSHRAFKEEFRLKILAEETLIGCHVWTLGAAHRYLPAHVPIPCLNPHLSTENGPFACISFMTFLHISTSNDIYMLYTIATGHRGMSSVAHWRKR